MNSSRKPCFNSDGQLWWIKLINKPFMWDPSWSWIRTWKHEAILYQIPQTTKKPTHWLAYINTMSDDKKHRKEQLVLIWIPNWTWVWNNHLWKSLSLSYEKGSPKPSTWLLFKVSLPVACFCWELDSSPRHHRAEFLWKKAKPSHSSHWWQDVW